MKFGELAEDAARREIREEIAQELGTLTRVGVLENVFRWGAVGAHEIVFVFAAEFLDAAAYSIDEQVILDTEDATRVLWRAKDATSPPLYPEGVRSLLASARASPPPD